MSDSSRLPRTVPVEVNSKIHTREPNSVIERLTWETLDTALRVLREGAVRLTMQTLREAAREAGIDFFATDEEAFKLAQESGDPDAPKNHLDLAPDIDEMVAYTLAAVFQTIFDQAFSEARAELAWAVGE